MRPGRVSVLPAACLSILVASTATAQASGPDGGAPPASAEDNFDTVWVTASSDHFLIYASGGARVARRALEEAERAVQALRLAMTINGTFPDDGRRLMLVLFISDYLYNWVESPQTLGLFRPAMHWGETDVVLLRGAGRFHVLRHELVHRLMQPVLPKAPPWLGEGMAQYFQWTAMDETTVTAGSTQEMISLQQIAHDSSFFPPLPELLATPRSKFYGQEALGLYSASFWLISTINSEARYRERFNQAIRAMSKGSPADVAWKRAFTPAEMEDLDRDYRSAPSRPDPVSHRLTWQPISPTVSTPRPLNRAETHVLFARLYGRSKPSFAREELDAAIERDPQNAEAFALRALFERGASTQRREDAERAVTLDPGAPLGWEALGVALLPATEPADRVRLLQVVRRLESFGGSAESQCLGAVLLGALGDQARALKLARAAVRISPGYFYGHVVLSQIASRAHADREAREARARAWALAPDGVDPIDLELLLSGGARNPSR